MQKKQKERKTLNQNIKKEEKKNETIVYFNFSCAINQPKRTRLLISSYSLRRKISNLYLLEEGYALSSFLLSQTHTIPQLSYISPPPFFKTLFHLLSQLPISITFHIIHSIHFLHHYISKQQKLLARITHDNNPTFHITNT